MELFNLKNDKIQEVELKPFKLEREIQSLIEKNTEILFNLEFIASELRVDKYRLDSLCYDNETNSFVIIEYKKGDSYSVIDQGYTYLQLLLNNKSDFILKLSQHYNKVMQISDVDFSQSKIIFVSQSFNSYQKDSVNFKNLPFELWEIKRFTNNTVVIDQHISNSNETIESLSNIKNSNIISSVNKEVKTYNEEDIIESTNKELISKWIELKENVKDLNGTQILAKKGYLSLLIGKKTVAYFNFYKNKIRMDFNRGNINVDGSKSKNYFTLDDPKQISQESSWEWKSGTRGNVYRITIDKNTDLDYIKFLIIQKYKNLVER